MINQKDRQMYENELKEFLPDRIFDCHIHVWLKECKTDNQLIMRSANWASKISNEFTKEELRNDLEEILPGKTVEGLLFGFVDPDVDFATMNSYVGQSARDLGFSGLAINNPMWSKEELYEAVNTNGLIGIKPYINFVAPHIATKDITILDMIPRAQLELANEQDYLIMLHLPRELRIADEENIRQLIMIENEYPKIKIIVAHIGRAYSVENLGNALEQLKDTKRISFDFSGNTNPEVIKQALVNFGSKRILYGSDLPITHMRMHRIYEDGKYINMVEENQYQGIKQDPNMREVSHEKAKDFTLFIFESLLAFKKAAIDVGLIRSEIEDVMYTNAKRLIDHACQ